MTSGQIIELPSGVKHYLTEAFAESQTAYDALTGEDGWEERTWFVDGTGACEPANPGARLHAQKEATIRGHRIVVFPPVRVEAKL